MKDLIFCVTYSLCIVMCIILFILIAINAKKFKTSRYFKVCRNLSYMIAISAFIASICLPIFSFFLLLFPIATLPIFWFNATIYHKSMLNAMELERKIEEYMKTQPIDVEYKELD